MRIPKKSTVSRRLNRKAKLFQILKREPRLTAADLQERARQAGFDLGLVAAYRIIRSFKNSSGSLEHSDTRCLEQVCTILQEASAGELLTAMEIKKRADQSNPDSLHQATIYRVLSRLCSAGLARSVVSGRSKMYEWRREEEHHGHLSCIGCGRTMEFQQDYLEQLGRSISERLGFEFAHMEFVVRCFCEFCRDRPTRENFSGS